MCQSGELIKYEHNSNLYNETQKVYSQFNFVK